MSDSQYPNISDATEREGIAFPAFMAEHYPRILLQIEQNWGGITANNFFDTLLLDNREDREGFPQEAIREIELLKEFHNFLFPLLSVNPYDPFSSGGILSPLAETFAHNPAANSSATATAFSLGDDTIPPASAPAKNAEKPVHGRGNWPKVRTQHELSAISELRRSNQKLYAQQGKPVGEILVHFGFSDEKSLRVVRRMQERNEQEAKPIGQVMVELGMIAQEDLTCALCVQSGIIMVDLAAITIPPETSKIIPNDRARERMVVPVGIYHDTLYLAVEDPFTFKDASFFTMLTMHKVEPVYAPHNEIVNRLNMHGFAKSNFVMREAKEEFRNLAQLACDALPSSPEFESEKLEASLSENDATIIKLVNKMILNAYFEGASDIHVELFQGSPETEIRFRRDGVLEHFSSFPRSYHPAVISRIKIMSGLDISERRQPQDGKISFGLPEGERIDLRVSTIPGLRGIEFITIRILSSGEPIPLSDLGMSERDMKVFRESTQRTYGLILVCGPTGSGKTTTLHSAIKELNTPDRKIWTAEDPVEIVQPHLCQVQVHNKIGLDFAKILRAMLRADPDVIMIGEMRDQETAKIALEASMTGHLVLSTLHTNSASDTVARLLDMATDPYNLSDALLCILAQRLARKLCSQCATREEATAFELEELANEYHQSGHDKRPSRAEREALIRAWHEAYADADGKLYLKHAVGCKACSEGYKGRIGLYELLQITPKVRHLIRLQSSAQEYKAAGIAEGMRTLKQDGIEKVFRGITDIIQVHSACA
ncbi:MAG: ATPase, T2SS/T4P/T4SS family [Sideroxydans sp.]|nr:ATPase, T2SS/T4P/T4SS family [Sideroxydans sp.]